MELFNKYIDEFVDWVTGEDTSNKEVEQKQRASSTGGLPVSGASIRELLLTRLKKPFVYYEDKEAGLYRLFSSESTRDKWIRMNTLESPDYDPESSSVLELFNFTRPSDFTMTFSGLDPNPKYIINGDSESSAAQLLFYVYLKQGVGDDAVYETDAFTVTYKVVDSTGVEHTSVEEKDSTYLNSSQKVTKNIYSMLTVGKNEVTVSMKARNSDAHNSISFPVYLIEFTLESSFRFYEHWSSTNAIQVPVSVKRSDDSLTLQVDVYIDGVLAQYNDSNQAASWTTNAGGNNPTYTFNIANKYAQNVTDEDHIKHVMKIEAKMYDQELGTTYYSNVLFFDFIIASNTAGILNRFVNIGYSVQYSKVSTDSSGNVILQMLQYEPFSLPWAYYTDRDTTEQSLQIEWAIRTGEEGDYTYTPITVANGINKQLSDNLRFIPDFYTTSEGTYLVAMYNSKEIDKFPISSSRSTLSIVETGGYELKLQAYGKTNSAADRDVWEDSANKINTTFVGINYDNNSGWDNNSFITSGVGSYAQINYCPIQSSYNLSGQGKTIEIDFKTEQIVNEDDVVMIIGDVNRGHIKITTNLATLYNGTNDIVHTNFKANERIKLAFIFNPVNTTKDSNLMFIVNNGVLERAASYGEAANFTSSSGIFKIGDSASAVRVYNIRCYNKNLTTEEELSNYIYDSDNKAEILSRNDIVTASVIDYNKVKNKIDTILLTGDLSKILSQAAGKEDSESTINFKRECISDASRTFEVTNGMIRKHGQSTLNYPITSFKIWTNKAKESNVTTTIELSDTQKAQGLAKNRYIMKAGAIPANKFVLQANYADSSGTHNGGLLRLILDTWYNASINGKHILRTAPLLFTSGEVLVHDDTNLSEDGSWVEGYGEGAASNKTWKDLTGKDFPYTIRNAPDSFPCAIFYKNGPDDGYHFLGQYVFMDDKKSDYLYGERSIYHFGNDSDPFVLKTENTKNGVNGKQDTKENRVWNNNKVLRIEIVLPNTELSSYMDFNVTDTSGVSHACTDIKLKENGEPDQYYWEDYFEMIYPDSDDVADEDAANGMTKFDKGSDFVKTVQPFVDFLKWITDCKKNYNKATDWWSTNKYSSTQQAFEATAADHLDMYKLAAYYIFFLRFGLVDSVERNAQLKTYDGQHWHYEPWDMDIALGNTNQGALVLDPPLDRNTFEPGTSTYAYSGRSLTTSNVLWDCLEAWDYWANNVVPNVAQALYEAGLTYDNIIKMFDEEYAEKWSETMYNESGHFKYIENGGADWLAWLQGSRTSHRHWWISTSMNYYDAKWSCGSFNEHRVRIFADKAINPVGTDIVTIKPTSNTFFKIAQQEGKTSLGTKEATRNNPAVFDISTAAFSAKDPSYIYGGVFIEDIDLSCFAEKLKAVDFSLCYDAVLGAPIKVLNIGLPYTQTTSTQYSGKVSGTNLRITAYDSGADTDAFANLQTLDITGQSSITDTQSLLVEQNRRSITNFLAIGTMINTFISSTSGNKFENLKLPATTTITYSNKASETRDFTTFVMNNSSWENLEFWNTTKSGEIEYVRNEKGEVETDDDGLPVIQPNIATFTKTTVPSTLNTVRFTGSTASNECSGKFVLEWIASIEADLKKINPSYTEDDLYAVLKNKHFEAENINWGVPGQTLKISYKDIARIAQFNNANNGGGMIKGYVMLSDKTELDAVKLNNLTAWFGPSVFTKGSQNSNLVIDQELDYVRITFGNTELIDGKICLREGNTTSVRATKFTLSEDSGQGYIWTMSAVNPNNQITQSGNSALSCKFYQNAEGAQYIIAEENGTYDDGDGGYDLTVTVYIAGVPLSQIIRIISAKLPDSMSIRCTAVEGKTGNNARKMYVDNTISRLSSLFTGNIRDSWVMFEQDQQVEFYPYFNQTPGLNGYADIKDIRISINNQPAQVYTDFTGSESDSVIDRVDVTGYTEYLYYTKTAKNKGIVLGIKQAPDEMKLIPLEITVVIGERQYRQMINVILYDDRIPMHSVAVSAGVQQVLRDRFDAIYGSGTAPETYFYKSDLFSLYGTLDFSGYSSSIGTVYAADNTPLIRHTKNISGLIFDNCINTLATGAYFGIYTNNSLLFETLPNLTTLSFNNCSNASTDVLDLTNCPNIEILNLKGTQTSVKLPNSAIKTLNLGSPSTVVITNPKVLTTDGVTIENDINLSTVELVNVNTGDVLNYASSTLHGYNIFGVLCNK